MARYVSRIAKDCRILRADRVELVLNSAGERYPVQVQAPLIAQFQTGLESTYERNFAIAAFTGRLVHNTDGTVSFGDYLLSPFGDEMRIGGATPNPHDSDVAIPGMTHVLQLSGYDITQKMSTFDTAWPKWSPEDERLAEELLDRDAGLDYFKVSKTRVAPPWPTYDEMRDVQGAHMSIPKRVRELGFSPDAVIAYEEQFEVPKQGIIDALRALNEESAAKAAEDASLTVTVS